MTMGTQIVGDELYFDGYVVAILAQRDVPATTMANFEHGVNNATLFEPEQTPAEETRQQQASDDKDRQTLLDCLVARSKNGLLRLVDACELVNKLYDGELN